MVGKILQYPVDIRLVWIRLNHRGFQIVRNQYFGHTSYCLKKAHGISDKVVDLGRRDDIKQFYNAFDAFLLPSLYEGMPVVGIEAQCAGLPIFFSKNITEETTASELAHYIGLEESAETWVERVSM